MASRTNNKAATGLVLAGIAVGMVGLSFAAVPLYQLFCQVTGYGGTTQVAEGGSVEVVDRTITVRFNADVNSSINWQVTPDIGAMDVQVGENRLAFYRARNLSQQTLTGVATFNVTPQKAGRYFDKVQCFCFTEQVLAPGEEVEMAVSFYIDPAIMDDPNLNEVETITLSYTFFAAPQETAALDSTRLSGLSGN